MQDLDLVRIKIEALREQTPQLARTTTELQRLAQLHYTTPLTRARRCQRLRAIGEKVRVILGSHEGKRRFVAQRRP